MAASSPEFRLRLPLCAESHLQALDCSRRRARGSVSAGARGPRSHEWQHAATIEGEGEATLDQLGSQPERASSACHAAGRWSSTCARRCPGRRCEAIIQPPAPSHPIARGRAGPRLLALVLAAKYGQHLPLTRQSAIYAREGVEIDVSTMADWVGAAAAILMPLVEAIRGHVFSAERIPPEPPRPKRRPPYLKVAPQDEPDATPPPGGHAA